MALDDGLRGRVDHRHRVGAIVRHVRVSGRRGPPPPRKDSGPRGWRLTTALRGRVDHRHRVLATGSVTYACRPFGRDRHPSRDSPWRIVLTTACVAVSITDTMLLLWSVTLRRAGRRA